MAQEYLSETELQVGASYTRVRLREGRLVIDSAPRQAAVTLYSN